MRFNLMVRSRGNIIVKDKALTSQQDDEGEESKTPTLAKLPTSKFPSQNEPEYKQCRVLLSDINTYRADLLRDVEILSEDQKVMVSS